MSIRKCLDILNKANRDFADAYADPDDKNSQDVEYLAVVEPNSKEALAGIPGLVTDGDTWEISDTEKKYISAVREDPSMSDEEKILDVYDYICEKYVYDDNLNYYLTKNDNGNYTVGDWYGRVPSEEWKQNRTNHNKRVCFELARIMAKSLQELLKGKDYETIILWDKKNVHYFVGMENDDYTLVLDSDNFNKVKDVTRMKLGLTTNGIKVLDDKTGSFTRALDNFNSKRPENLSELEAVDKNISDKEYITECLDVLKKKNLDAHGYYEMAKRIIRGRNLQTKNLWKLVDNSRYERCLIFIMPDGRRYDEEDMKDDDVSQFCVVDSQKQEMRYIDDIDQLDRRVFVSKRGAGPINSYRGDAEEEER
jgi:hypothetical protein